MLFLFFFKQFCHTHLELLTKMENNTFPIVSGRGRGKFQQPKTYWRGSRTSLKSNSNSRERLDQTGDDGGKSQNIGAYLNADKSLEPRGSIKRLDEQTSSYYATKQHNMDKRNTDLRNINKYRDDYPNDICGKNRDQLSYGRSFNNRNARQASEPRNSIDGGIYNNTHNNNYHNNSNNIHNEYVDQRKQRDTKSAELNYSQSRNNPQLQSQTVNRRTNQMSEKEKFRLSLKLETLPPRLQKKFLKDYGLTEMNLLLKKPTNNVDRTMPPYSSKSNNIFY